MALIFHQEIQKAPATSGASCSDYKADGYECVPYYQCEDGEIIDDGAGLIDIRFVQPLVTRNLSGKSS